MHTIAVEATPDDPSVFRMVMGQYPTGVSVITAVDNEQPVGMVVGSFTSVSLDPPLVAFLPATTSSTWPRIRESGRFCANFLASDQEDLCRAMATSGGDKFQGVSWSASPGGAPVLEDVVGWVDCRIESVYPAGDHEIVIGRVEALAAGQGGLPMVFFRGGYGRFSPHSLTAQAAEYGPPLRVVDSARRLMEEVAQRTGTQIVAAYCDGQEHTMLATAGTPTDRSIPPAVIGQAVPVSGVIGLWWIAFASKEYQQAWADGLPRDVAARYLALLQEIRNARVCVGSRTLSSPIRGLIDGTRPHAEFVVDPDLLSPTRLRDNDGDVVSLWSPAFAQDGEPTLGFMMTGYPHDCVDLTPYAEALTGLASDVTAQLASADQRR
ncbi:MULTISPECIES: flavin reductase family protein [unclassified Aeromicrobium]|uniref:flavin reductase family protein n=1 Tax=unclassified Aeromicrobium TaxID=2633570 RepID=UPI00396AFC86